MRERLSHCEESALVFAARYAHARQTGAALAVVNAVIANAHRLSEQTKEQLVREARNEATCNHEEWELMISALSYPGCSSASP